MSGITNNSSGFALSLLLIFAFLAVEVKTEDEPMSNIRKLRKDLLDKYDKYSRPVKNASTAVHVHVKMHYLSLAEMDEAAETMALEGMVLVGWTDQNLKWNPENYGGLTKLNFGENEIWRPDIFIFYNVPVTENMPWSSANLITNFIGMCFWAIPTRMKVHCPTEFLKPTEEKTCNVTFASYSHYKHEMDLKLMLIPTDKYLLFHNDNPIWEIKSINGSEMTLNFDTIQYALVTFAVRVKRRRDFVGTVTLGPRTIAILLTLIMFWLPPTSDKKLNLGCLALLVLSGVILYLSSTVTAPSLLAATVSRIKIIMFTITSALLIEIIILNLSRLSDLVRPSPTFIRILSGAVGRVIGVCPRLEYKEDTGLVRLPETDVEDDSQPAITIEEEWSLFAMSLDRIFFIIYSVIFICIS